MPLMLKNVIIVSVVLVFIGGLYVSQGTLETLFAMVGTAQDVYTPDTPPQTPAVAPKEDRSGYAYKFGNSLMKMDEGVPQSVDTKNLGGVKYWAFYYSASWCPPCRAFTPQLVRFYRIFKPSHPEFELVFISCDKSESEMLAYMRDDAMRWPAVWYADIDNPELEVKKYMGQGIPCLVLVDNSGNLLASSEGGDPQTVIDAIQDRVK